MPVGPYSPCPGGTGKKVKFCCPELLGELQKIERMLEAEQYQACLRHVEHLEKAHPDKACLLSTKAMLLRGLGRLDDARATVTAFLQKHPDNPVALAESAMLAATTQDGRVAIEPLTAAIAICRTELHGRVYQAISLVSQVLAVEGRFLAARRLALIQATIHPKDPQPMELLVQLNSSAGIPLVVKDDSVLQSCPDDAPWKAAFDEATLLSERAELSKAVRRLTELAEQFGDVPAIWRNLATVRGWLAATPGCIQALQKFATLDVPLEEAVEAEALSLFLSDDPLGDRLDILNVRYPVEDAERLQAALSAAPRVEQAHTNPVSSADDEGPPPKGVFLLFDHTALAGTQVTAEAVPRVLCRALLYGRQTDRDPRLEVIGVVARDLEQVKALLAESAGDELGSHTEEGIIGQISATQELLTRNWRLPEGSSREEFQRLVQQYVDDVVLETWPRSRLGLLDGKSPQEVAGQEAYRVRLLAAIMVLEFWLEEIGGQFDFNNLRNRLELPTLEPIDPRQTPIEHLPLVRLSRVMVDGLSDEALLAGYRRAMAFNARAAVSKFARAVVERSSLAGREERLRAFAMMARMADDSNQALRYVEEGRQAAEAAGLSSASWDILELSFRFERGEGQEASRLINHLQSQHVKEPGVARALTNLLIQVGVLRPDGTPAVPPGAPTTEDSSLVIPGQSAAGPGEIWTPDSQKPAGEKPGIWTPGAD